MNAKTTIKLYDIITGSEYKPIAVKCNCPAGCPKKNKTPCLFFRLPTTTINDMAIYVNRMRSPECDVAADTILEAVEGI